MEKQANLVGKIIHYKNEDCEAVKDFGNKIIVKTIKTYTKKSLTRTLKAGGGSGNIPKVLNDDLTMFRKLTPIECERLQSVPLNYTDCVSNNQRYRMLGDGWTVDVIAHILGYAQW